MKILILFYSHTGNNAALADRLADELKADKFRITELRPRNNQVIALDMLFNRRPQIEPLPEQVAAYDLVLFLGPVWMYHLPSPLRSCFQQLKDKLVRYAFVSVSGGALGPNPGIAKELVRRMGKRLAFQIDLTVAQFGTVPPQPSVKDTSAYQLAEHPTDLDRMAALVVCAVRGLA